MMPATDAAAQAAGASTSGQGPASTQPKKRKGHRGGKKKRQRRKSFAVIDEGHSEMGDSANGEGFYQLPAQNLSGTSMDSEALLDHR